MKKPKKLIFFGNERLATGLNTDTPTVKALVEAGFDVAAIVSNHTEGSSRSSRTLEMEKTASALNIPLLLPDKPLDITEQLKSYQADAGVLVAYGKILPLSIIEIFPAGIINIHPSLLPKYRGPTPVETAILDGVNKTGVSLMQLVPAMDAGPVYVQGYLELTGKETKQKLADSLLRLGGKLLVTKLEAIIDGGLKPQVQVESAATYTHLLRKQDGFIEWDQKPAHQIEREVRAYSGFPKSRAKIWSKYDVIVTKCRVVNSHDDKILVIETSDGLLEILELIAPSGKTVSGADFKLGYKA